MKLFFAISFTLFTQVSIAGVNCNTLTDSKFYRDLIENKEHWLESRCVDAIQAEKPSYDEYFALYINRTAKDNGRKTYDKHVLALVRFNFEAEKFELVPFYSPLLVSDSSKGPSWDILAIRILRASKENSQMVVFKSANACRTQITHVRRHSFKREADGRYHISLNFPYREASRGDKCIVDTAGVNIPTYESFRDRLIINRKTSKITFLNKTYFGDQYIREFSF